MSQSDESVRAPETAPGFLIHNEGDHVAVAVQDNEPGALRAVYMDSDRELQVQASEAIPLGHKLALVDLAEGEQVIEYGVPIGLTRQAIKAGQLMHTHNIRSVRWQKSL